jgi:endonuclease/exonuclease/phosphatase family metal-dependent hydrolase
LVNRRAIWTKTEVRFAVVLIALLASSCTTMENYLEPDAPRFLGAYASAPVADGILRVVTFNVEHGRRIDRAIAGLRTHPSLKSADVIMLQEMDGPGVEEIAKALGMNYVYFPGSHDPKGGHDMGNAVLSPWPMEDPRKILLPHPSRIIHRARAVVTARVTIEGRPVRVYSVHLGSPLGVGPGARREQAEMVLKDAAASADPLIVAGDFNTDGLGERFVKEGYVWATRSIGHTVGPFSFDHVFLRGLSGQVEAGVAKEVNDASDHRPVWTTLAPR